MGDSELRIGAIVGTFGVSGELKLDPTDAGFSLFVAGAVFSILPHERTVEIASVRSHKGRLLVRLREAPDMTSAEIFVGAQFYVPRAAVDAILGADEILDVDLIGTELFDLNGRPLGDVRDVVHFPSSAMLVVGPQRRFVPFVKAYISAFDRSAKRLIVDLPAGLLDEDEA